VVGHLIPDPRGQGGLTQVGVEESSVPPWTGETDRYVDGYGYDVVVSVEFDDGTTTELSTKLGYPLWRAEVGELHEGDVIPVR
jgi:hypothetical protein